MSTGTAIQWAHDSLNPWIGCQKISPACANCYAAMFAGRFFPKAKAWDGTTVRDTAAKLEKHYSRLENAKQPRRIFCGSMTDLGLVAQNDPDGLADFMSRLMRIQRERKRRGRAVHHFLWLTKRPAALKQFLESVWFEPDTTTFRFKQGITNPARFTFPGLWIGVTAENQETANERLPILAKMPMAEIRWMSAEPLLGDIDIMAIMGISWVVCGGETGHRARPMHPAHAQHLLDQCRALRIPFFFKSWGAWTPPPFDISRWKNGTRGVIPVPTIGHRFPDGTEVWKAYARNTGREIDHAEWDEFPTT